jgi:uncharacterized protein involved in exopolysaccharide biosynthesis
MTPMATARYGMTDGAPRATGLTLADLTAAVRRRSRVAALCFVALSAGAVAAVVTAPAIYEGDVKLLVQGDRADSVVSGASDPAAARSELSEAELLSQVELIKADDLLTKVAAETGLARRPEVTRRTDDEAEALALASERLDRDLSVAPIKRTWLIDVAYRSEDRALTRNVLDTLVRLYLEKHLTLHRPAGTYQFFSEQAERARGELDAARDQLARFSQQHRVVSAGQQKDGVLQKLLEFEALRSQADAELAETSRRLSSVTSQLERVPAQHTSQVRTSDDAGVIQDVKARILTLELKRAELLQKFTPAYRGVREIEGQLAEARAALTAARTAPVREETVADNPTRQWLDTELARVQAEDVALRGRVQALAAAASDYRTRAQTLEVRGSEEKELLRNLAAAEQRYLLYIRKQEEARISDELDRRHIGNVVVAQPPTVKFEPTRRPGLAMLPPLLAVALMLSVAIALALDALTPWRGPAIASLSPSRVAAPDTISPAPAAARSLAFDALAPALPREFDAVNPAPPPVVDAVATLPAAARSLPAPAALSDSPSGRTAANNATLGDRLQELRSLTEAAEARWAARAGRRTTTGSERNRWLAPLDGILRVEDANRA